MKNGKAFMPITVFLVAAHLELFCTIRVQRQRCEKVCVSRNIAKVLRKRNQRLIIMESRRTKWTRIGEFAVKMHCIITTNV